MTEEGKVRLMVIPIVAMLAVTMIVAGYYQEEEQEIEVYRESDEFSMEYLEEGEGSRTDPKEATAFATVDNESELEFVAEVGGIDSLTGEFCQLMRVHLSANGSFEAHPGIEYIMFRASDEDSEGNDAEWAVLNFGRRNLIEGEGKVWSSYKDYEQYIGTSHDFVFEGFDIESSEFSVETELDWEFHEEHIGEEFTLEIEAVVGGLSEDVIVPVYIHIEGGE